MALILKGVVKMMDKDYKNNGKIKWNSTKFLIDRDGAILARFEPTDPMDTVAANVKEAYLLRRPVSRGRPKGLQQIQKGG